jgi:hypothetical protein
VSQSAVVASDLQGVLEPDDTKHRIALASCLTPPPHLVATDVRLFARADEGGAEIPERFVDVGIVAEARIRVSYEIVDLAWASLGRQVRHGSQDPQRRAGRTIARGVDFSDELDPALRGMGHALGVVDEEGELERARHAARALHAVPVLEPRDLYVGIDCSPCV